jgi:hypothetical protein
MPPPIRILKFSVSVMELLILYKATKLYSFYPKLSNPSKEKASLFTSILPVPHELGPCHKLMCKQDRRSLP